MYNKGRGEAQGEHGVVPKQLLPVRIVEMATNYQYDAADYGQQRVSVETPSQGLRWSRLSLRVLSIICSGATLGFAAYYNSYWSLGPLIMNGPPVSRECSFTVDMTADPFPGYTEHRLECHRLHLPRGSRIKTWHSPSSLHRCRHDTHPRSGGYVWGSGIYGIETQ